MKVPVKFYAGIGSRQTPENILNLMTQAAQRLSKQGYTLRSGGAIGADRAFERGSSQSEIYRANDATEKAIAIAATVHPAWHKCNDYARKLHGRNVQILFGKDLNSPVKFVICWTKDGLATGGTGLGIRLAEKNNIPIFNLFYEDIQNRLRDYGNKYGR